MGATICRTPGTDIYSRVFFDYPGMAVIFTNPFLSENVINYEHRTFFVP